MRIRLKIVSIYYLSKKKEYVKSFTTTKYVTFTESINYTSSSNFSSGTTLLTRPWSKASAKKMICILNIRIWEQFWYWDFLLKNAPKHAPHPPPKDPAQINFFYCFHLMLNHKSRGYCIQNVHLGRYISGYIVGNSNLWQHVSVAVKRNLRHVYPTHFCVCFKLKIFVSSQIGILQAACHPIECDVINYINLLAAVYCRYTFANF